MKTTMLQDAYALCSVTEAFNAECDKLRSIFSRLNYLRGYIESVISKFSLRDPSDPSANVAERDNSIIRINRSSFQRSSFCLFCPEAFARS